MSNIATQTLQSALHVRLKLGNFRTLSIIDGVDFCSNDYLGLSRFPLTAEPAESGSTGSRLISGHDMKLAKLEADIATFHGFESALLFSSGYTANTGLLSCIAGRDDAILSDELIHASLIDGIRLSYAERKRFAHNDVKDLEAQLETLSRVITGQIYVVVEALYSMDGDIAPIVAMSQICQRYNAALIVDEAHSVGVYGAKGQGLIAELGLEQQIFAAIYTFGKAVGFHGAAIVGTSVLRDYLINFCRPFIYTTAPSPQTVAVTTLAYERFQQAGEERKALQSVLQYFNENVKPTAYKDTYWLDSNSPIQGLIISGNTRAKSLEAYLQANGFATKAILSPTVATGAERIRFSLHSFNTEKQMDKLVKCLNLFLNNGAKL